jgi:small subunit ribosomal protein S6
MSRKYEVVYILSNSMEEEQLAATTERIRNLIETSATLISIDEWGLKTLAYEINDEKEGLYYLTTFEADADFPAEFERVMKITEGVLRFLVVKIED